MPPPGPAPTGSAGRPPSPAGARPIPTPRPCWTGCAPASLPAGWAEALPDFEAGKDVSTRKASGEVLAALADPLPEAWGGSADLAGSNNTTMKGQPSFLPVERSTEMFPGNPYGRTLHFGIREHAMGAIVNGIALHGLTRPYGGTFLVFSDYMRPAVRLAALMGALSTFVWTHDSIGLGEDGPTHQPVEHLTALRAIPGLDVVRPADAAETAQAWRGILERHDRPAGIVLTRQDVPNPARGDGAAEGDTLASAEGVLRGAYVLAEARGGVPDVLLLASGSEVQIALAAREQARRAGRGRPGGVRAEHGVVRRAGRGLPRGRPPRRGPGPGLGRGRDRDEPGGPWSATPAGRSRWSTTAPRGPTRSCTRSSA